MTFLEDMRDAVERLAVFGELDVDPAGLPASAMRLSDASVRDLLTEAAALMTRVSTLQSVLAGVASARSGRERGHGGLVQESGHRNTVEFLREVTGTTRGEAIRAVKVGEALLDGVRTEPTAMNLVEPDPARDAALTATPWHQPLSDALLAGAITTAHHNTILRGLGAPPSIDGRAADDVVEAWRAAAQQLAAEAPGCTVEGLGARARTIRDMIDPMGAEERFAQAFQRRSYRWSTAVDGAQHAHITFDPEMGAWVRGAMDAALSPRRGGPRFVADDDKRSAETLAHDPRTNEQLAYDLFIDVFRAGARAEATDVFGAKEAGVRLVTLKDAVTGETTRRDLLDRLVATTHSDDGMLVLPGSALERALCDTATVEVTLDTGGSPLDVGREHRLFTPKQRLMLSVRDGGCVWPGCDRPPAYCEAHHCDHWADGGRTDCAVGVLLCRFHHLNLHNRGWRIDRIDGVFVLHPPPGSGGDPIPLRSKSPLRWLWDPPPQRTSWRHAA